MLLNKGEKEPLLSTVRDRRAELVREGARDGPLAANIEPIRDKPAGFDPQAWFDASSIATEVSTTKVRLLWLNHYGDPATQECAVGVCHLIVLLRMDDADGQPQGESHYAL